MYAETMKQAALSGSIGQSLAGSYGGNTTRSPSLEAGMERLASLVDRTRDLANRCSGLAGRLSGPAPEGKHAGQERINAGGIVGGLYDLCDQLEAALANADAESYRAASALG